MEQIAIPVEELCRPLARASDPATSKAAAYAFTFKAGSLCERIVEHLRTYGPADTDTLAARLGVRLVSVSPRMRPLVDAGLVAEGPVVNRKIQWSAT